MLRRVAIILIALVDVSLLDMVSTHAKIVGAFRVLNYSATIISLLAVVAAPFLVASQNHRIIEAFDAPLKRRRAPLLAWAFHPCLVLMVAALAFYCLDRYPTSVVTAAACNSVLIAVLLFLSVPFIHLADFSHPDVLAAAMSIAGFVLLGLMLLIGTACTDVVWDVAKQATVPMVQLLLASTGAHVEYRMETTSLSCNGFNVRILPACSGLEGIALFWLCFGTYLLASRNRLSVGRAALIFLPLGTALVWLLNTVRIALLVAIGASGHPALAIGGFHTHAGWLFLDAVVIALILVVEARYGRTDEVLIPPPDISPPVGLYVVPQLVVLALGLLAPALAERPEALYPLTVCVGAWVVYKVHPASSARWLPPDHGVLTIGLLAYSAWMILEPARPQCQGASMLSWELPPAQWGWVLCRIIGSVVIVPLIEELAFRGFLMRRLASRDFTRLRYEDCRFRCLVGSALLFGLLHSRATAGIVAGVLFGHAARRRGRLADAVMAHAITNGLVAATVISTGWYELW